MDDDQEDINDVVVSLRQEALAETSEGGQATLGVELAQALGLGCPGVGSEGGHASGREPLQPQASWSRHPLQLGETGEGADQALDVGRTGRAP